MAGRRAERMGELLREEISAILARNIKDPRVGLVSLTVVRLSNDLSTARVFFVMSGDTEAIARARDGLRSAAGFIRRELKKRLPVKTIPEIDFQYDDSLDYGNHIDSLLKSIRAEHP